MTITTGNFNGNSVNHPAHYNSHPSGIEVIAVIEGMNHPNLANSVKYLARARFKDDTKQDLEKCIWYLQREMSRKSSSLPFHDPNHFNEPFQEFIAGETDELLIGVYSLIYGADLESATRAKTTFLDAAIKQVQYIKACIYNIKGE